MALVDTGPLVAAANVKDGDHARCLAVLQRADLRLIIPALVVAEASYLVGRDLGVAAEANFLRGVNRFEIEAPRTEEWSRIADLVEQYADFPLGGTDASIVALAERLNTDVIITLDRRHFGAVRPRHVEYLRILPE